MIRAKCRRRGDRWELDVRGHAGSAPYGQDLVCAAVTALVCALARYVSELHDRGELPKPPVLRLEPGDAQIFAEGKGLSAAFRLTWGGLRLLQEEYPENVEAGEI